MFYKNTSKQKAEQVVQSTGGGISLLCWQVSQLVY